MSNTVQLVDQWVVIHDPKRIPAPYAAYRYVQNQTVGWALDGLTLADVQKQIVPGAVIRPRDPSDDPRVVEWWDIFGPAPQT